MKEEKIEESELIKSKKEKTKKKKKKLRMKEEEEDEEDEDEEDMEKEEDEDEDEDETEKGEMGGQNQAESASDSTKPNNTTTPSSVIGNPQNVFVPQTQVSGDRFASGSSPSEASYSGKSVNPDLMKSPLFVELSGQIDEFQKAVSKKIEAVEKSVSDRMVNIQKAISQIEEFYKKPFYKAIDENVSPESIMKETIETQIKNKQVRYS